MALRRLIYVLVLPFLTILFSAVSVSAKSGKGLPAACNIQKGVERGEAGYSLLNSIILNGDEGILTTNARIATGTAPVQARERDNILFFFTDANYRSAQALPELCFILHTRDERAFFVPIARLLIFPKHWFW